MSLFAKFFTLVLAIFILCVGFTFRMATLQWAPVSLTNDDDYVHDEVLPAYRGDIIDSQGEMIATNTPGLSVMVEPQTVNTHTEGFVHLAELIQERLSTLRKIVRQDNDGDVVFLKRRLPFQLIDPIQALGIKGLYLQLDYLRLYPEADITAHLIGQIDEAGRGVSGVEQGFNEQLRGIPGIKRVLRDEFGRLRPDLGEITSPKNGAPVQLSIDLRLQQRAYRELQKGMRASKANLVSVLMVNAETGEIMALASLPSYDPGATSKINPKLQHSPVAADAIHPGAAVEPLLLAAALDSKLIEGGKVTRMNPAELIAAMNPDYLQQTMKRLGFGSHTEVYLPEEVKGLLPSAEAIANLVSRQTTRGKTTKNKNKTPAFLVTSLQLARAYTVFAGEGARTELTLLKQHDAKAKALDTPKLKVLDRQTTAQLLAMMRIRKQRIDAKTKQSASGLVQFLGWGGDILEDSRRGFLKVSRKRRGRVYVGMAPFDQPKVIGVVVLRNALTKRGKSTKKSETQEPAEVIFARLAESALHLLGVPPQIKTPATKEELALTSAQAKDRPAMTGAQTVGMTKAHRQGSLL